MPKRKNSFPPGQKLSTDDVLRRFGISRWTLHRWHSDEKVGFPKPIFINRRHYFDALEITRWELRRAGVDPDLPLEVKGAQVVSNMITDYDELVRALIAQRSRLKLTCAEVDARAGMQESYTNKLENYRRPNGRGMGPETFPLWLGALRVAVVLVELPRATRGYKDKAAAPISHVDETAAA
ncbi:helix-turn-helix transcriptional regulator [Sinorhizobium meliloti]|uniref:helix-turn-helix transcriptional regulator n=1 Tax=Rhizobium meliloti TaxID=382 RepID=UPI000FDCA879|nr:DNA-binding protein [Sinorhizobium meliloti]RVL05649.1 DNA-binding protein [Sinorhizobium meliloti]RVN49953.1 DNA-binding protein [Sinorhizobium meliloti]